MKTEEIKNLLRDVLPAVNFDADFLFTELDSLGVATILFVLSEKYHIHLDAQDITPKNFKSVESIANMVRAKMSLESKIRQFAVSSPDKVAVVCGDDSMTYSQLWDAITRKAEALKAEGLKPQHPYVYRINQDIDFLVTYCAVHTLKAVAVPIVHDASDEFFQSVKQEVDSFSFPAGVADALFTTGTTGKSKGAMLSELSLTSCSENFTDRFPFSKDLCFIVSGPLNHIASLFKIHPTLSAGGTVCIVDGLKDMNVFFKAFDLPFKEFAAFLVPASLRIIMQYSYEKLCSLAPRIAFIETGAAPISKDDMERLSKALPHSRLYNGYGSTEFGCASAYDFNDGKYMEGCVGRPYKNVTIEIAPDSTVVVSGLGVMSGYVNDEENTRIVLADGKIHTSDLGYFDEDGLLHLTGRAGDVINVGGYKVNPIEVESIASSYPGIKDSICIAAKHPVIGPVLKLLVVTDDAASFDKHALAVFIKSKLEGYKVPTMYEVVDSIHYTYNGKKDRKAYKEG